MLAIAAPEGSLVDLGLAQVTGFEAIRFETASRFAITAAALAALETVQLAYTTRFGDSTAPGLLLRGPGVFLLSGFALEGLDGFRRLAGGNRDLIDVSAHDPYPADAGESPFLAMLPHCAASEFVAGNIAWQAVAGAYTILRGYGQAAFLGPVQLMFQIRVDGVAEGWSSADFIL